MSDAPSILVVDDDDTFRERLVKALRTRGFDARGAASPAEALQSAREDSPELAVVDLRMPTGNGLEVVDGLRQIDPETKIVVLTGYGSIATAIEAMKLGAVHYLQKPADIDQIMAAFEGHSIAPSDDVPSLARVEWEHIHRVLQDCDGNVSRAARILGLHRRSLQRKLSKLPGR